MSFKQLWEKIFGSYSDNYLAKIRPLIAQVKAEEVKLSQIKTADLAQKTADLKAKIVAQTTVINQEIAALQTKLYSQEVLFDNARKLNIVAQIKSLQDKLFHTEQKILATMLPKAFALIIEASRRLVGMKYQVINKTTEWVMIPFDVQILGGITLHQNGIAEMKTGEGKTLVATMPAFLNALVGKGVHIVTVNDYLAQRDAEIVTPLFELLGLSVGFISSDSTADIKKIEYQKDIIYSTNNELGFDYLRDNMAQNIEQMVSHAPYYAIVDEVDSILIDEARTPLIISAPAADSTDRYQYFANVARQLNKENDFSIDEKTKSILLNNAGIAHLEDLLGVANIYTDQGFSDVHHIENALKAHYCYIRDKDYLITDDNVMIIDEFTGRVLSGRRFSDGLHQALEAKENVSINQESNTLATITLQNYFRLYPKLAGMTGTAMTEAEEFNNIYGLKVISIPTNKPITRLDKPDAIYKNEQGKFTAVAQIAQTKFKTGQPILIGTTSVEKSEFLSKILSNHKIPHNVLNAKQHAKEAEIIENAGQKNAVTIATNMAGRGTDIKLGQGVVALGGLAIISTERHESRRIDNQLRGRAGRQGDPGETQFFISMEDSLVRIFGGDNIRKLMEMFNFPDDEAIENSAISRAIANAQKKVEAYHFDSRKHILKYDDVLSRQRDIVYKKRKTILQSPNIHQDIIDSNLSTVKNIINIATANLEPIHWNYASIVTQINNLINAENLALETIANITDTTELLTIITEITSKALSHRLKELSGTNNEVGFYEAEKIIFLRTIDELWMSHLTEMTHLRDAVALRSYGQKDPLVEYQNDGFTMFEELMLNIAFNVSNNIFRLSPVAENTLNNTQNMQTNTAAIDEALLQSGTDDDELTAIKPPSTPNIAKVGRNELCPCHSGKKYKKCHGKFA